MAIDMFLEIEGVEGATQNAQFKGQIDVLAWSWGASRDVPPRQLPLRVRLAKLARKKAYLNKAGFETNGKRVGAVKPKAVAPADGEKKEAEEEVVDPQAEEDAAIFQDLVDRYDSEDETDAFKDDECAPYQKTKPNVQDISLTKYSDASSAALIAMTLTQRKGVKMTLRLYRPPENAPNTYGGRGRRGGRRNRNGDDEESKDEEKDTEPVVWTDLLQTMTFHDTFVTSVSTGGSGGEDRLTENVTFSFAAVELGFVDRSYYDQKHEVKKAEKEAKKAAEKAASASSSTAPEEEKASSSSSSEVTPPTVVVAKPQSMLSYDRTRGKAIVKGGDVDPAFLAQHLGKVPQ